MRNILFFVVVMTLSGCIGTDVVDDLVEERVTIDNIITSLKIGESYQFLATYSDNTGTTSSAAFLWNSSDESVISIDVEGLATGISDGFSAISVSANGASTSIEVKADTNATMTLPSRIAPLETVSSYPLSGTATLIEDENGFTLTLLDDFTTTSALPGLYVYLTNNPKTINNALEIAKVKTFKGTQSYDVLGGEDFGLFTYNYVLFYCKPFLVPVGVGELKP